jgi:glucose-1-phosphate thymidylyltransferase
MINDKRGVYMKGIIMAGGLGTRLYPLTKAISKHLIPIYDKPMIYYPLSILMKLDITDILIICTEKDIESYKELLGDGSHIGISISYMVQQKPKGIAHAFIIGEDFIGKDSVALILGDNIFYGNNLLNVLQSSDNDRIEGATIFAYEVKDPMKYGIVEFDDNNKVLSIEEKPNFPKSKYAVVGLYFYDNKVVDIAKKLKPSSRLELEITDINNIYRKDNKLEVKLLQPTIKWFDTGTYKNLLDASTFVEHTQNEHSRYIGCIEEIAYEKGYISHEQLIKIANSMRNTEYSKYLESIVREK